MVAAIKDEIIPREIILARPFRRYLVEERYSDIALLINHSTIEGPY